MTSYSFFMLFPYHQATLLWGSCPKRTLDTLLLRSFSTYSSLYFEYQRNGDDHHSGIRNEIECRAGRYSPQGSFQNTSAPKKSILPSSKALSRASLSITCALLVIDEYAVVHHLENAIIDAASSFVCQWSMDGNRIRR
jgi:hypothetical protein